MASLVDTHIAEVALLKNYLQVLEEQLARKPSLHHGEYRYNFPAVYPSLRFKEHAIFQLPSSYRKPVNSIYKD